LQHGAGRIPSASTGASFMRRLLKSFFRDDSGATAIEYALIAMGISIVIVASVNGIGTGLNSKFTTISTSLK
jgi:pilus assembly protein Flp/PilA